MHCRAVDKRLVAWSMVLALLVASPAIRAQEKTPAKPDGDLLDLLDEVSGSPKKGDLPKIAGSHLSPLKTWQGVRPARPAPGDKETYAWAEKNGFVTPLGKEPISTSIQVPAAGKYRVYLRHVLAQEETRPTALRLAPVEKGSGAEQRHVYGAFKLPGSKKGSEHETELPVRFESELHLNTFPDPNMPVWEYWDVELAKGAYRVSLESDRKDIQVDALFLTASTSFRPSFSEIAKDNSLQRIHVRFRGGQENKKAPKASVAASLTYHWRGRSNRAGAEM